MAAKSWILLVVACLLSDVIGKCIGITKRNANFVKCTGFAEFDAGKEHNIVFQYLYALILLGDKTVLLMSSFAKKISCFQGVRFILLLGNYSRSLLLRKCRL